MAQNDIDIAPNNTSAGNNPIATNTFTWNGKTCNSEKVNICSSTGVDANVTAANALKVDGSAVTQPISAVSLPLPTGAAQDGVDGTGITPPTGGSGQRGWLSGIYKLLLNGITATFTGALPAGTNNIGHVTVDALPSIPAGSNGIGSVTVSNFPATQPVSGTITANAGTGTFTVSGTVSANTTMVTGPGKNGSGNGAFLPCADSSAKIDCAAASTQTIVSGVVGKVTYVCSYGFIANGTSAGTVQFAYGSTPTALTGAMAVTAETGIALGSGLGVVLVVPSGQDLKIVTTGGATAQGSISYFQV